MQLFNTVLAICAFTYNYTVVLLYTDWSKLFVRNIVLVLQAAVQSYQCGFASHSLVEKQTYTNRILSRKIAYLLLLTYIYIAVACSVIDWCKYNIMYM